MTSIDFANCPSLTAMFFEQAARHGDKPLLWRKRAGEWIPLGWRQAAEQVNLLARGLRALGVEAGDRVLLVSESRPEWPIADLAIMAAGAVTVPGYTTNTVGDHLHLMNNARPKLAIVSSRPLAERLIAAAMSAETPPGIVVIDSWALSQNPGVELRRWDDVLALGTVHEDGVAAQVAGTRRTDTACIIYTSGTGGAPKGVMLSHGAILSNCLGAHNVLQEMGLEDEVFLSFLPLSHSYEHTAGQFFPMSIGAQIYYAEAIDQLASNMVEVRPTIMTAVPRLYETMRARILHAIERTGGTQAKLFNRAVALGIRRYEGRGRANPLMWIENAFLDLTVRRKVAARFGGRLKAMVSGGGPLNYDVGLFFTALGVRILQGYGQTETAPVVSVNRPNRVKVHTVGPPVDGVEVRLAEDGEILVRGELVMQGYWNDPRTTREVFRDGWLHTGDVGRIDEDGYIQITDRKRDIIVNSGGDNVSPQRIEGFLTLQPEIAQAMVYGDRRPHLVGLLVPDPDHAQAWAAEQRKPGDLAALVGDADFRRHIGAAIDRVNRNLSPIEKVRRFLLTPEPFTVDNEMCTPTLKIRRHVIVAKYGKALQDLYDERRS